ELALPQPLWWSSVCVAMRTLMQGNYPEAERQIMSAFSTGQNILLERSDSNDGTGALAQQLYQLRFDQGRIAELEPLIRTQVEQNPEILAWRVALALAYTSMDRQDDARREYELVMEPGIESWRSTPFYGLTLPVAAEVCAVLNDEANAADLYERLLAYEGTVLDLGWRTSIGSADRYLGLLANTLGRFDVAQRHFEVAIATNARMNARPWLARTQHEYAVMLLRRDEPGDREH